MAGSNLTQQPKQKNVYDDVPVPKVETQQSAPSLVPKEEPGAFNKAFYHNMDNSYSKTTLDNPHSNRLEKAAAGAMLVPETFAAAERGMFNAVGAATVGKVAAAAANVGNYLTEDPMNTKPTLEYKSGTGLFSGGLVPVKDPTIIKAAQADMMKGTQGGVAAPATNNEVSLTGQKVYAPPPGTSAPSLVPKTSAQASPDGQLNSAVASAANAPSLLPQAAAATPPDTTATLINAVANGKANDQVTKDLAQVAINHTKGQDASRFEPGQAVGSARMGQMTYVESGDGSKQVSYAGHPVDSWLNQARPSQENGNISQRPTDPRDRLDGLFNKTIAAIDKFEALAKKQGGKFTESQERTYNGLLTRAESLATGMGNMDANKAAREQSDLHHKDSVESQNAASSLAERREERALEIEVLKFEHQMSTDQRVARKEARDFVIDKFIVPGDFTNKLDVMRAYNSIALNKDIDPRDLEHAESLTILMQEAMDSQGADKAQGTGFFTSNEVNPNVFDRKKVAQVKYENGKPVGYSDGAGG